MKRLSAGIAISGLIAGILLVGCGKKEQPPLAVQPVTPPVALVAEAKPVEWPIFKDSVATVEGETNTEVKSQVTGFIVKQAFAEGAMVKAGDVLFLVNAKPFEGHAKSATASEKPDSAANYARITSPVDGFVNKSVPGLGDLIKPGMTVTTISAMDPVRVSFAFVESATQNAGWGFSRVFGQRSDARQDIMELRLADGTLYPYKGSLLTAAPFPTPPTAKAMGVLAQFPNPDHILRPGEFVRVSGLLNQNSDAVTIPRQAVRKRDGKEQVMVVKADDTVDLRDIKLGEEENKLQVIDSGLKAGERVIIDGSAAFEAGTRVTPQPYVASGPDGH